jgi:hypothetical protein
MDKPTIKKALRATAIDLSVSFACVTGLVGCGLLAMKAMDTHMQQDNIKLTLKDPTFADKCMEDVLENEGVLRLPLPDWEEPARTAYSLHYIGKDKAPADAAMLTPEIVQQCETLTGTKHNVESWAPLLSLRP